MQKSRFFRVFSLFSLEISVLLYTVFMNTPFFWFLCKKLYALYNTQVNTKKHYEGDSMYPQLACRESGAWWEPDDKEDTENHSGVAVRTVLLLSRLCRSPR